MATAEQISSKALTEHDASTLSPVQTFSDDEEELLDTSEEQRALGKDVQGIPWERLHISRAQYRSNRLRSFVNYFNLEAVVEAGQEALAAEVRQPKPNAELYNFSRNWRSVHSTFIHFQLRNLLWATSKHDLYLVLDNKINHWSGLSRQTSTVLDLSGGSPSSLLGRVQVSTMCLKHRLLAAGGFTGELVLQNLSQERGPVSERVTTNENGITNGIDIYKSRTGALRIMASNNDCMLRSFDGETVKLSSQCTLPWPVNYSVVAPEGAGYGDRVAVVGDAPEAVLLDAHTGKVTDTLRGHLDYSFAAAWHPNGLHVATGNQDSTTRLWDVRNTSQSFATLRAHMGAVRSLRFSPDGSVLAVAEPADFVTLYDVAAGYDSMQEIDIFGEIAGISFSPRGERFFVSISDLTYSSMLQYERASGARPLYSQVLA